MCLCSPLISLSFPVKLLLKKKKKSTPKLEGSAAPSGTESLAYSNQRPARNPNLWVTKVSRIIELAERYLNRPPLATLSFRPNALHEFKGVNGHKPALSATPNPQFQSRQQIFCRASYLLPDHHLCCDGIEYASVPGTGMPSAVTQPPCYG